MKQVAILGSHGQRIDAAASNFGLSFVDGMAPRDAAEALLLAQMAAIHQATMLMARRLNHAENLRQQDAAERALDKMARTYSVQMDSLKRYRSKGQQVVRVEWVNVESGGHRLSWVLYSTGAGGWRRMTLTPWSGRMRRPDAVPRPSGPASPAAPRP